VPRSWCASLETVGAPLGALAVGSVADRVDLLGHHALQNSLTISRSRSMSACSICSNHKRPSFVVSTTVFLLSFTDLVDDAVSSFNLQVIVRTPGPRRHSRRPRCSHSEILFHIGAKCVVIGLVEEIRLACPDMTERSQDPGESLAQIGEICRRILWLMEFAIKFPDPLTELPVLSSDSAHSVA
jgi:hypothetical protein